jgi:carbamoyl-phosphate synthase large subunit
MTDPVTADYIYLRAADAGKHRSHFAGTPGKSLELPNIDAVLPTMGGQTALNLAIECEKMGIWEKYGVRMIGVDVRPPSN